MEEELNFETLKEQILNYIDKRNAKGLRELFETVPTIDIAEAMDEVEDVKYFLYIFRVVSSDFTGDFFSELTSEQQEEIKGVQVFLTRKCHGQRNPVGCRPWGCKSQTWLGD